MNLSWPQLHFIRRYGRFYEYCIAMHRDSPWLLLKLWQETHHQPKRATVTNLCDVPRSLLKRKTPSLRRVASQAISCLSNRSRVEQRRLAGNWLDLRPRLGRLRNPSIAQMPSASKTPRFENSHDGAGCSDSFRKRHINSSRSDGTLNIPGKSVQ